jgi:hypothetical protein
MRKDILRIVRILEQQFLNPADDHDEISIFLCGGSDNKSALLRRSIGDKIVGKASSYRYSVYYPEDMFIELIMGSQKRDLLTLENLLANSVDSVAIMLQSPGTFTELGAFSNFDLLKDKLIVVVDPKYSHKKSFINYGPLRYLKNNTRSKVLFLELSNSNLDKLVSQISKYARNIAKHSKRLHSIANPLKSYNFYLSLIYIFEPIEKESLLYIVNAVNKETTEDIFISFEAVIISLCNEGKIIFLDEGKIAITPKGIEYLIFNSNTKKRAESLLLHLSGLRIRALNLILRKRKKEIWGEVKTA